MQGKSIPLKCWLCSLRSTRATGRGSTELFNRQHFYG